MLSVIMVGDILLNVALLGIVMLSDILLKVIIKEHKLYRTHHDDTQHTGTN